METIRDNDLDSMSLEELKSEVIKLRAGIRQHRDASGHNLCWYCPELWDLLPEKVEPKPEIPSEEEFLECCRIYRNSFTTKEQLDEEREIILAIDLETDQ